MMPVNLDDFEPHDPELELPQQWTFARVLARYWPWLAPLAFVLGYEPTPTLSALVWEATGYWPWLALVTTAGLLVLLWHFFIQKKTWKGRHVAAVQVGSSAAEVESARERGQGYPRAIYGSGVSYTEESPGARDTPATNGRPFPKP
jgi:hypothetical protein